MKILLLTFGLLFTLNHDTDNEKWGQIGHYVTGEIAERHLTDKAAAEVSRILGDYSLPRATVWMDDIRSDSRYDYTNDWHWATIPNGMRYEDVEDDPDGKAIWAMETIIEELKAGGLSADDERDKLKFLIHLVGDIHQPLHVGTGEDRGGNSVRVTWMGGSSNLHRVWDSDIINSMQMSYTELANELDATITSAMIAEWQSATVRDWAHESMEYRDRMYDLPEDMRIGYEYRYFNKDIIFKRLAQAGIRMAGLLNEIYGE